MKPIDADKMIINLKTAIDNFPDSLQKQTGEFLLNIIAAEPEIDPHDTKCAECNRVSLIVKVFVSNF